MDSMEGYWAFVSIATRVFGIAAEGWIVAFFVKPFLDNRRAALIGGSVYSAILLVLYLLPREFSYPRMIVLCAVFGALWLLDKRNASQKLVLLLMIYLLCWIAQGVALVPRDILYSLCIYRPAVAEKPMVQFVLYVLIEVMFYVWKGMLLFLMSVGIHKIYGDKRKNINGKELTLFLCILSVLLTGYFGFTYLSDVYVEDTGWYIWNLHKEYIVLRFIYQLFSGLVLFIVIALYQKIKKNQREEKENAVLTEQMEHIQSHIGEVEKLYEDIRALKHEMGNHIVILENLILQNEKEETEKYFSRLKENWKETFMEIKTGNPVTDVILTQKKKEMQEKGIRFECEFFYPSETKLEVFDVSIILNNALINAVDGAAGCSKPYVSILSYQKKNVYMIEVKNSIRKKVQINEETGLPDTTKEDKENHGFGLVNIRRIAQKYYGAIDIAQEDATFSLTIMLMEK